MADLIDRQVAIAAVSLGALSAATVYGRTDEGATALRETIKVINALPSAQPTQNNTSNALKSLDCVDRQAALDAIDTWDKFGCDPDGRLVRYDDDNHYVPYVHYDDMVHAIKHLPSALPKHTEERTETHACDCISRQSAIEALGDKPLAWTEGEYELGLQTQWQSDVDAPTVEPQQLSCDGCRHNGMWDDELENGYDCPCIRCIRNVRDNYEK